MSKPKLLHITSSLHMGGAEHTLVTLVKGLSGSFDQTVFFFHDGPYRQQLEHIGVPTVHIKGFFFRYDPLFFVRLYRAMRRANPDVIHSLLWAANVSTRLCAWLQKKLVVSAYHNNIALDGRVRSFFDRATIGCANKLVCVSDQVAHGVCKRSGWLPSNRIAVIPNGIAAVSTVPVSTRQELDLPDDAFVIGAIGRFVPVKRFDLLLRLFAQLSAQYDDMYLLLVGYGALEQQLREQVDQLALADRVRFVIGQSAQRYIPLFDCFVQPTRQEGVSIALLEVMLHGVACLVMSEDGAHPVIQDGHNGLVVHADDHVCLSAHISTLYDQASTRAKLAQSAKATIHDNFMSKGMVFKYENILCEMMKTSDK